MIERKVTGLELRSNIRESPQRGTKGGDLVTGRVLQHRVRRQPPTHTAVAQHLLIRIERQRVDSGNPNRFQPKNFRRYTNGNVSNLRRAQLPQPATHTRSRTGYNIPHRNKIADRGHQSLPTLDHNDTRTFVRFKRHFGQVPRIFTRAGPLCRTRTVHRNLRSPPQRQRHRPTQTRRPHPQLGNDRPKLDATRRHLDRIAPPRKIRHRPTRRHELIKPGSSPNCLRCFRGVSLPERPRKSSHKSPRTPCRGERLYGLSGRNHHDRDQHRLIHYRAPHRRTRWIRKQVLHPLRPRQRRPLLPARTDGPDGRRMAREQDEPNGANHQRQGFSVVLSANANSVVETVDCISAGKPARSGGAAAMDKQDCLERSSST